MLTCCVLPLPAWLLLQEECDQLRHDVDERSRAAAKASEDSCAAEAAQLRQQVRQLQAALAEKDAELSRALSALSNADSAHLDAYHALQAEAMMLRTRLGELLPIEDKYKAVLLENRDLYNTVQDLRGNIRVFCRCVRRWRPVSKRQAHACTQHLTAPPACRRWT